MQKHDLHKKIAAGFVVLVCLQPVSALADEDRSRANGRSSEGRPSIEMTVPEDIQGYTLRIGGEEYGPGADAVTVTPVGRRKKFYVELVDSDRRSVFAGFRRYEPDALTKVAPRNFRRGGYIGFGTVRNGDLGKLYTGSSFLFASVHAQWQPSMFGVGLNKSWYSKEKSVFFKSYSSAIGGDFAIDSHGVALIFETAPFSGPIFFRRLHLAAHAGVSQNRTLFVLREKDLTISETDHAVGRFANIDVRMPLANIWLDFQIGRHVIPLELKKLEYRRNIYLDTQAVGVRFAF